MEEDVHENRHTEFRVSFAIRPFDIGDTALLRAAFTEYFAMLEVAGKVPSAWAALESPLKLAFQSYIYLRCPCLRRCEGHWKVEVVDQVYFTMWKNAQASGKRRDVLSLAQEEGLNLGEEEADGVAGSVHAEGSVAIVESSGDGLEKKRTREYPDERENPLMTSIRLRVW